MKNLGTLLGIVLVAGQAAAAPMRPAVTKENRLPESGQMELSGGFQYAEYDLAPNREYRVTAQARWGLADNLALYGRLPLVYDERPASARAGLGDVAVGFEFRPFEEVFGYPWIMPHMEIRLGTGAPGRGLDAGVPGALVGVAVGSTMLEVWHLALDVRYEVSSDGNAPAGAFSVIWDLSRIFSLSAETVVGGRTAGLFGAPSVPVRVLGGMHYQVGRRLMISALAGSGNARENILLAARAAYTF